MFLYNLLLVVHLLITIALILIILVQSGKGAEMGAIFGGSGAVFGGVGATTLLHKLTIGLAAAFMLTSLWLAVSAPKTRRTIFQPLTTSAPSASPMPAAPIAPAASPAAPAVPPAGN